MSAAGACTLDPIEPKQEELQVDPSVWKRLAISSSTKVVGVDLVARIESAEKGLMALDIQGMRGVDLVEHVE